MIECANYWSQPFPGNSSSEYLNVCGIDSLVLPYMLSLFQHAYFGNGYAGICSFDYITDVTPPSDYREYIQGTLSESLKSGQCYYCEFWVESLNLRIPYSTIDALGIYFSDTLPQITEFDSLAFIFPAQINNTVGRIISDTNHWTKIAHTFVAKGGEKYFTVGTFKLPSEVNQTFIGTPQHSMAYYFFDNFSLCPCADTIPADPIKPIFEVYPNPAKDELSVMFNGYDPINTIDLTIYNILGELVMNKQIASSPVTSTVNIGKIASGCYILVIKTASTTLYKDRLVIIK
jgi:hypothetical protein